MKAKNSEPEFIVTVTLIVADIARSVAFYRDVLGATVLRVGEPTLLRLQNIWITINIGGGEFHIIVLQHTDCGITRLVGDRTMLAHYFQIQEPDLKKRPITAPRSAVATDVAALRAVPALPSPWLVSGLVYNVATGLVEVVVPPAPLRAA